MIGISAVGAHYLNSLHISNCNSARRVIKKDSQDSTEQDLKKELELEKSQTNKDLEDSSKNIGENTLTEDALNQTKSCIDTKNGTSTTSLKSQNIPNLPINKIM